MFTFVLNKQFEQLITISTHVLTMLKIINAEFQSIQLWFTDQNKRPLEIEESINITLYKYYIFYKNEIFDRTKVKKIFQRIRSFVISKKIR